MFRRALLAPLLALLLSAPALAQPQAPDPALLESLEPYLDLTVTVTLLLQLETESDLPLTPEQARALMPLLIELDTSPGYTPERAVELRDAIELGVLTTDQLLWIDGAFLAQQEAAEAGGGGGLFGRFGGGQREGGGAGGGDGAVGGRPEGGGGGQAGGPGGANRALFQQVVNGEPVNLFLAEQGPGVVLDELMGVVGGRVE